MYNITGIRALIILLLVISTNVAIGQAPKSFVKVSDGILVYPQVKVAGSEAVRLQVINDNIIRVVASPTKKFPKVASLVTVYDKTKTTGWAISTKSNEVELHTSAITAVVSLSTGAVSFKDKSGKVILSERTNGRQLQPAIFEGEQSYKIKQTFETTSDDAYYGLGQHQSNQFNYKGNRFFCFKIIQKLPFHFY